LNSLGEWSPQRTLQASPARGIGPEGALVTSPETGGGTEGGLGLYEAYRGKLGGKGKGGEGGFYQITFCYSPENVKYIIFQFLGGILLRRGGERKTPKEEETSALAKAAVREQCCGHILRNREKEPFGVVEKGRFGAPRQSINKKKRKGGDERDAACEGEVKKESQGGGEEGKMGETPGC